MAREGARERFTAGGDSVRVRDLLGVPGLGLRLLTDVAGTDRMIRHVYTTDLPDPSRYLTPGDLVLTGLIWYREPGDADQFVTALVKAGAAALGAGEAQGGRPERRSLALRPGRGTGRAARAGRARRAAPGRERRARPAAVGRRNFRRGRRGACGPGPDPQGAAGLRVRSLPDQAHRGGRRAYRGRGRAVRRAERSRQCAAAGRAARHHG